MSKQKDKYLTLRSQLPELIDEYISYLQVDVEEPSPKMVERLSVIQRFLNSYAITIDKEGGSLSLTDLEKLPFTSEASGKKIYSLYFSRILELSYEYLLYN